MTIREDTVVPEVQFPVMPDSLDEETKKYLTELEIVLRESLKGSLWLNRVFEDGKIGNG